MSANYVSKLKAASGPGRPAAAPLHKPRASVLATAVAAPVVAAAPGLRTRSIISSPELERFQKAGSAATMPQIDTKPPSDAAAAHVAGAPRGPRWLGSIAKLIVLKRGQNT